MSKNTAKAATHFKIGDTVKWTGKANGSEKEHEGVISTLPRGVINGFSTATVLVSSVNKRTGAINKAKQYTPRLSALKLVKAIVQ